MTYEEDTTMGGKPKQGTLPDTRLKENKPAPTKPVKMPPARKKGK
jgi:hypothetical protein